jgi:hypothetical protein
MLVAANAQTLEEFGKSGTETDTGGRTKILAFTAAR